MGTSGPSSFEDVNRRRNSCLKTAQSAKTELLVEFKVTKMLSNPLHRFSPYNTLSQSNFASNGHVSQNSLHNHGLESLAHNSHYSNLHLIQGNVHDNHTSTHLHQPYKGRQSSVSAGRASTPGGPVRRRISRACDQCNQLRTKCDGQHPCAHCTGKHNKKSPSI